MTTEVPVIEAIVRDKLSQVAKVERAIDRAFLPIADSIQVNGGRKGVEDFLKKLKQDIKDYLEDGTENAIYDGELNVEARLQTRSGTPQYDLVTLSQREGAGEVLIEAARAGVLRADDKALQRFIDNAGASWAETINRMKMPGKGTVALLIGPPK